MTISKYPKAQAFLDAHPALSIDEAIEQLDYQIKQLNRNGVNNADGIKL